MSVWKPGKPAEATRLERFIEIKFVVQCAGQTDLNDARIDPLLFVAPRTP